MYACMCVESIRVPNTNSYFIAVAGPALFASNGHYYELVASPLLSFDNALATAALKTYKGLPGHLVTVTTQEEYNFITSVFVDLQNVWIAANDKAVEGTFRWVAGPEAGQLVSLTSGLWAAGAPDDAGGNEDCVQFWDGKKLNDGGCHYGTRYLIEYEGIDCMYGCIHV
jgi:hypothetical protein